ARANIKQPRAIGKADHHRRRTCSSELAWRREQTFSQLLKAYIARHKQPQNSSVQNITPAIRQRNDISVQRRGTAAVVCITDSVSYDYGVRRRANPAAKCWRIRNGWDHPVDPRVAKTAAAISYRFPGRRS